MQGEFSGFAAYNRGVLARTLLRLALMVSVITVVAPPPPAHAASRKRSKKKKVRKYKSRAFKAFSRGDYGKGIRYMRKAHKLLPHPGFLLNIAVAYDQWGGHCGEALGTFDEFFEACPDCSLHAKAVDKRATVREHCPSLVRIESTPPGATLSVDGVPKGMSPQTLKLPPGPHQIEAVRPGFVHAKQDVEVRFGGDNHFTLALDEIPAPPPPVATAPPPAPPPADPTPAPAPPPTVRGQLETRPEPPASLAPWTWTAFGVAAAGAAVGTVFTLQTFSALDAEEQARADRRPKREVEDLQSDARSKALVANIGFGAAAAGLVTGVVLLIVDGARGEPEVEDAEMVRATPLLGPGGAGVMVRF